MRLNPAVLALSLGLMTAAAPALAQDQPATGETPAQSAARRAAMPPPVLEEDQALQAAIASPTRPAADVARDSQRHPHETLTFWGLKPKQTVIELQPGSGYWTEILAPYAKATGGTYIAGVADLANPKLSEGARKGRADFEARFADAAKYGKPQFANFGPVSGPLGAPGSALLGPFYSRSEVAILPRLSILSALYHSTTYGVKRETSK
jgi:hypothetical protein